MARAGTGDFSARAEVVRNDEIGSVAVGLNEMLPRLEHFNVALQERVEDATHELRLRNEELVDSYRRVFVLREALARAEQLAAVGQMAASVAHQVGTPLNLISGYVQMMQEDASADARTERRLQIVQEQIGKVAAVVRTLLDQARREGTRQPVEIGTLLSRVADVARPKLDASRIGLRLHIDGGAPAIVADAEELELAILNLISNALDAMPSGGELSITAAREGDGVRVEVSDTGSGITADLIPRIFLPWVTTKPTGRGTGLGLSITHDVITRHGGTINVTSHPGRGTTFTILLPSSTAVETPNGQTADC
jgi:signal transduction histidine kinase